eukprot:PhM_4_TR15375/c0_g1_i1/m.5763/K15272/SLC35A1_2_3; solute carrier family 35 (UDP-sugar transporter), member A1/2/3
MVSISSSVRAVFSLGTLSLLLLVLQNSSLVLVTRFSRSLPKPYHNSSVIILQETLKLFICLGMYASEKQAYRLDKFCRCLSSVLFTYDVLKFIVPAGLFTLQTFLIFVSLSHLDVMTFQVLSQTKLISAAVFSVWLLDRRLERMQWLSLLVLTLGVIFTQAPSSSSSTSPKKHIHDDLHSTTTASEVLMGAIACIVSGLSSSFAGVYFEKVVKTTAPSLAVRNIQLSIFGVPLSIISMLFLDGIPGYHFSFWQGYGYVSTWSLVVLHASGGLLVAVVVKYADNILKGFATGVAIIVSGLYASLFWGFVPSGSFVAGSVLVIGSSVLYQYADAVARQQAKLSATSEGDSSVGAIGGESSTSSGRMTSVHYGGGGREE